MALNFSTGTQNVSHGSASALDNLATWTQLFWFNPSGAGTFRTLSDKRVSTNRRHIYLNSSNAIGVFVKRTSNSEYASSDTVSSGTWYCLAVTFDSAASAGETFNIYLAALGSPLAEVSYSVTTDGSGAISDESSSNLVVGNKVSVNEVANSVVALYAKWNRVLTLAELRVQQLSLLPLVKSGLLIFANYGFNGTGTQPDWSGNGNNGTVTGATVAPHVPLAWPLVSLWAEETAVGAALLKIINESQGLPEANSRLRAYLRSFDETLGLAETTIRARTLARIANEVLGLSELAARLRVYLRSITETLGLAELASQALGFAKVVSETLGLAELDNRLRAYLRPANETVGLSETTVRARVMARIVGEILSLVETPLGARVLRRILDELVGIAEGSVRVRGLLRVITDALGLTELLVRLLAGAVGTPPERTHTVPFQDRVYDVPEQNRTYVVPFEDRTYIA